MTTIEERENLLRSKEQPLTGFTARRASKLATEKPPKSALDIECNHFARLSSSDASSTSPPFEYQLWLLASQQPFLKPERPDPQFNTSVWRNVAQHYGVADDGSPRKRTDVHDINQTVSAIFPLNIAMPSRLGGHSFSRFVEETNIFKDRNHKLLALDRAKSEEQTMKELRIKSESRVPPIDLLGNIVPPDNFEKHGSYDWRKLPQRSSPLPPSGLSPDLFGNMVQRRPVRMWKLTYQDNHPSVIDAMRRREELTKLQKRLGHKSNLLADFESAQQSFHYSP